MKGEKKFAGFVTGLIFLIVGLLLVFVTIYLEPLYIQYQKFVLIIDFCRTVFIVIGISMIIPYKKIPKYIFDPLAYKKNKNVDSLVLSLRLRATLLNNLSVLILIITIIVIGLGFYLLIDPPIIASQQYDGIAIRSSATILLIFLVQILFRVFKYILRLASFYHGKSDAIEYYLMRQDLKLDELMGQFTPDKYDITDLPQSSVTDNIVDLIKGKK